MATIKDVAREAGVAVGTVSKVINNIAVKPATKALVDDAIKKLNYEPNVYARGLKVNKTNTIALIIPTIWNPFFSELTYNIEKNLRKFNIKMILCNSEDNELSEIEYITMVKQNKVDGIIAITYNNVDEYVSSNIPIVSIDRYFSENITYVTSDNYNGGKIAAEKLVECGCKSIAYIGRGSKINNATRKRKSGFVDFCKKNNIKYNICDLLGHKNEFETILKEFLEENIKNNKLIDGIFAATDEQALSIIEILKNFNLRVPEDVQIIGYDGIRYSKNESIKISTIRQPVDLMASEAVNALVNLIDDEKEISNEIILPVKFIEGYTTLN